MKCFLFSSLRLSNLRYFYGIHVFHCFQNIFLMMKHSFSVAGYTIEAQFIRSKHGSRSLIVNGAKFVRDRWAIFSQLLVIAKIKVGFWRKPVDIIRASYRFSSTHGFDKLNWINLNSLEINKFFFSVANNFSAIKIWTKNERNKHYSNLVTQSNHFHSIQTEKPMRQPTGDVLISFDSNARPEPSHV